MDGQQREDGELHDGQAALTRVRAAALAMPGAVRDSSTEKVRRTTGCRFAPLSGMEYDDDPTAHAREQRFRGLVDELLPRVRRFNPTMPDDQVLEMAESMAELRLLDEELG